MHKYVAGFFSALFFVAAAACFIYLAICLVNSENLSGL